MLVDYQVWARVDRGTKGKNMQLEDMLVIDGAGRLPGLGKGGYRDTG